MKSKNIRKNINLGMKSIISLCSILLVFSISKSVGLSSSMSISSNYHHIRDKFGDISIINDFVFEKDTAVFAISIDLNEGWYSYWRHAGDIGLPTMIYFDHHSSLKRYKVFWPRPKVKDSIFGVSLVYDENVTIPVLLNLPEEDIPLSLMLNLELGVCKDICIPIKKRIKIELDKPNSSLKSNKIELVLADIKQGQVKLNSRNFHCSINMREGRTFFDFKIKLPDEYINSYALLEYGNDLIDIMKTKEKILGDYLTFSLLMNQSKLPNMIVSKSQFTLHVLSEKSQASVFGCN